MPKTGNTGSRTWICTGIIAPAFPSITNLEPIWIVVRYALNVADIRSKLHDYRLVYFNQDKRNDSLSDLERNYQSCSEEIVLTKQRGIGFGAFLSLGMQLQQQKWPKYFAYVEILCRVVQTDIFVRLHEL